MLFRDGIYYLSRNPRKSEQFYIYSHIQFHLVYAVLVVSLSIDYIFVFTKHDESDRGRGLCCRIWYSGLERREAFPGDGISSLTTCT